MKKLLVACEYSGRVREAFRNKGWNAYSCDLLPSDDNSPYHIQGNCFELFNQQWDMIIAHPPCTFLTVAGNRWMKEEYKDRFPTRTKDREEAIKFFMAIWNVPCNKLAIENPVGIMSSEFRKPDQIIQPYQFGDKVSKATCLWTRNLPKLVPTNIVEPEMITLRSGKRMSKLHYDTVSLPKFERSKQRSLTFQGIANAMAEQWSS